MRLNKYISETGACSRREADQWIEAGRVTLNGVRAELGLKVQSEDEVRGAMSVVQIAQLETEVRAAMREIGAKARVAAREVANAPAEKKNRALMSGARILRQRMGEILAAN